MNISLSTSGETSQTLNYWPFISNLVRRGTRFTLSRDELLTLPEFVLLSLFPNGLLPDGHMGTFHEGDIYPVDVSKAKTLYCFTHGSLGQLIYPSHIYTLV